MNRPTTLKSRLTSGFTLIEMMVIAPIVILLIGSFVALIVNLTGEVLSARGLNTLTHDVQDALNRIEQDAKLSTTYLAVNNIDVSTTKQGYGGTTSTGSTTKFTNIDKTGSGGSNASIILNSLVTNDNPISSTAGLVYLANKPNDCSNFSEYSKNTPMTMNIVYFVDSNKTLWRRVIMPSNYTTASVRCGAAPWQIPSCINGYVPASLPFCKSNDERLIDGVDPADFKFGYYATASSVSEDPTASNQAINDDTIRNTALQSTPTLQVSITSRKTIAGREISRSASLRVTRLDTNASSIAIEKPPTSAPAVPSVSGSVSDGHVVTFTWPRISGAESYDLEYRINGGAWQSNAGTTDLDNNSRSYKVTSATHTDIVEAHVRATNSFGDSAYGSGSVTIPLWAPLVLKGGWTDYGNDYSTAAYTKTKSGLVMLKGLVKNSKSPGNGDIIGSLPQDYKPSGRLLFGVSTSPNASARVDVNPTSDGADVIFSDDGNSSWFSLDTVHYIPATGTAGSKVTPSLQNGFIPYGGAYEGPSYIQDPTTKRVTIQGLLNNGTRSNGTIIFTLPTTMRPSAYQHHPSRSATFHHLGIDPASGLLAKGDGTAAYSINTTFLPSSVSGWANLSLVNGWTWYGGVFSTPQYVKTSDGLVQLKGLIGGGSSTYGSVIATLPPGFRPKARILSVVPDTANYGRLDILPNGQILYMGTSNTWYALDGMVFPAEQ